jgi:hypothetical protein
MIDGRLPTWAPSPEVEALVDVSRTGKVAGDLASVVLAPRGRPHMTALKWAALRGRHLSPLVA